MLWTRGVAAREALSYLDRRGIDADPALLGAGLSRGQLSRRFTHARNSDLRKAHHLLQCPIDFAQAVDSSVLPQRVMDLPIISADSYLVPILRAHAGHLVAERHSINGLQNIVVNQLVDLLPSGESRAAAVAQRLGMSTGSFTRRLALPGR